MPYSRKRRRYTRRSYRRRSGKGRGISRNFHTAKTHILLQDNTKQTLATRTLYKQRLTDIPWTGDPFINNRIGAQVLIRGVKLRWELRNDTFDPICFNWAIVVPKGVGDLSTFDIQTNFFRGYGSERGTSFGTTRKSIQLNLREINTDKVWVLKHKRKWLGPKPNVNANNSPYTISTTARPGTDQVNASFGTISADYTQGHSSNWCVKQQYIRLNRNAIYQAGNTIGSEVYLLYWWDCLLQDTNTLGDQDAITALREFTVVFRDNGNS